MYILTYIIFYPEVGNIRVVKNCDISQISVLLLWNNIAQVKVKRILQ